MKCEAITEKGTPCPFSAIDGTGRCYAHHPDHAIHSRNGAKGAHVTNKAAKRKRRKACSLRTIADCQSELERCLIEAENSAGQVAQKVGAKVKVLGEVRALLQLQAEFAEDEQGLREVIATRYPHLAEVLRTIPYNPDAAAKQ